ncbi:hypothetical protein [Desulfatibacillum aliphaticivorans]|uniref:hypothetical protein n=1 Tax=Desulfatibacillum aliphaticivorans TaxID=218208 RepID=UPI000489B343|nr:hypothetical protein [Desulfatibacillum aliphaticivorans]
MGRSMVQAGWSPILSHKFSNTITHVGGNMAGKHRGAYYTIFIFVCFLPSAILSSLLVRGFFFNANDERIWSSVWRSLFSGELHFSIGDVLLSSTFAKLASTFTISGFVCGFIIFTIIMAIWD